MKRLSELVRFAPDGIPASVHADLFPTGNVQAPTSPDALADAEAWLRARGCTRALGPMETSTWSAYRANLGPAVEPPFHGEPTADPAPFHAAGYAVVARYTSTACPHAPQIARADARAPGLRAAGWRLGDLAALGTLPEALVALHGVVLDAFRDAFAYTPLAFADFAAQQGGGPVDPGLVLVAFAPDGSLGGFCFGYRDPLRPAPARLVVKTLAVRPAWRRHGVGQWLVGEAHRVAASRGYAEGIHALMGTASFSQRITAHGGRVIRRYALYGKDL